MHQLSYGFNILEKLEGCPQENQNPNRDIDFSKTFESIGFQYEVWNLNLRFSYISCGLIFKGISSQTKYLASLARRGLNLKILRDFERNLLYQLDRRSIA